MAMMVKTGEHFNVENRSVTLFGLQGSPMGNSWAIGINFGSGDEPSYVMTQVSPAPAREDVLAVIEQDKADGNLGNIRCVMMSSRVAVRLFLDGTIKASDFDGAEESTMDTSQFIEGGVERPVVNLKSVKFGEHTFPVSILSEAHVGSSTFATLDENNAVV
ncbi:MAG: hypothetical protein ABI425_01445 [Patescibacteria group bacterium]